MIEHSMYDVTTGLNVDFVIYSLDFPKYYYPSTILEPEYGPWASCLFCIITAMYGVHSIFLLFLVFRLPFCYYFYWFLCFLPRENGTWKILQVRYKWISLMLYPLYCSRTSFWESVTKNNSCELMRIYGLGSFGLK